MGGQKKKHAGVLAIDPSWKGLAVAAYVPVHGLAFTKCADIRNGSKCFDTPPNTIRSVTEYFRDLFQRYPQLRCCTRLVIENQFKTKMRNLEWIVISCVKTLLHDPCVTVEYVSILKLKEHFALALQHNYQKNKNLAVSYVEANERQLLCGAFHKNNDNRADAILLLNFSVQTHKLEFMSYGECKVCGNELVQKESQSEANPGRQFITCPNGRGKKDGQPGNKCNNSFQWLE